MSPEIESLAAELQLLLAAELEAGGAQSGGGAGLDPEDLPTVDLRTLLGEMAALRVEVRAETTASRQARTTLEEAVRQQAEEQARGRSREAALRDEVTTGRQQAVLRVTPALFDLVDRLEGTHDGARTLAGERQWLSRRLVTGVVALADGLALTLERTHLHLRELGLDRVTTRGRPFDPSLMEAVATDARPNLPDGHVLEELSSGWRTAAALVRPARVVVNRIQARKESTP